MKTPKNYDLRRLRLPYMTVARQGLEPQLTVPETVVLPLDDRAAMIATGLFLTQFTQFDKMIYYPHE